MPNLTTSLPKERIFDPLVKLLAETGSDLTPVRWLGLVTARALVSFPRSSRLPAEHRKWLLWEVRGEVERVVASCPQLERVRFNAWSRDVPKANALRAIAAWGVAERIVPDMRFLDLELPASAIESLTRLGKTQNLSAEGLATRILLRQLGRPIGGVGHPPLLRGIRQPDGSLQVEVMDEKALCLALEGAGKPSVIAEAPTPTGTSPTQPVTPQSAP